MTRTIYLLLAVVCFAFATVGADVIARTSVAGEAASAALKEHLYWAGVQIVGTLLLFAPFGAVAIICSSLAKRGLRWTSAAIFLCAMLALTYFYFDGYHASQQALLDEKWTASALAVGLLPFFIGVPVVLAAALIWLCAVTYESRVPRSRS